VAVTERPGACTPKTLDYWGFHRTQVEQLREHDEAILRESAKHHKDEKKLIEIAARAPKELESLFEQDEPSKSA